MLNMDVFITDDTGDLVAISRHIGLISELKGTEASPENKQRGEEISRTRSNYKANNIFNIRPGPHLKWERSSKSKPVPKNSIFEVLESSLLNFSC